MNALNESHRRLTQATDRLRQQWQTTATVWQDKAQQRFEKDFWSSYEPEVAAYLKELESLATTMARAEREVS